jgi:hypothetical protein
MTKKYSSDEFTSPAEEARRQAELEQEAARRGIEPWRLAAARAVPTSLVQDLVNDFRSGPAKLASMAEPPKPRGSGWVDARPFPDRSGEFELVDRIVERMVGGPNSPVK